ncbi:MAG: alpha/beta hydrolase [Caulobacteraceae bacterium]|jgi:acetyl esterase/lipase
MSLDTLEPPVMARGAEEIVELWPDGPPGGKAPYDEQVFRRAVPGGAETLMLRNVSVPTLTLYRPDRARANGVGVIVCPGGGWSILAWEHEGVDIARWLAARGYSAFLLKYRVTGTEPDPVKYEANVAEQMARLEARFAKMEPPRYFTDLIRDENLTAGREMAHVDGQRALALVRERAAEWGVTDGRVGMIGFSAGGFLTADVAMDPGGAPLTFAAPIYGGETTGKPVPADAPPIFIAVAVDDHLLFSVVRGLFEDWTSAKRSAEMHAFARGGHGFGSAQQGMPSDRWLDQFGDWLVDQGFA